MIPVVIISCCTPGLVMIVLDAWISFLTLVPKWENTAFASLSCIASWKTINMFNIQSSIAVPPSYGSSSKCRWACPIFTQSYEYFPSNGLLQWLSSICFMQQLAVYTFIHTVLILKFIEYSDLQSFVLYFFGNVKYTLKYSISIIINYSSTTFKLSQSLANGYSGHFKGAQAG